ncbi:MAG: dUTP diphosphatase [Bacteroidetes bacterium]|nr:dUTP diphosphatase [Bacteroidota bacterium]
MSVSVINESGNPLPEYQTLHAAGMDLLANLEEEVSLQPGERKLIGTGLKLAIPEGYEAQIRPRSGLALKHGITVLNSPGTIDSDYRGEIKVLLINHGQEPFSIKHGERIAQLILAKYSQISWEIVEKLPETARGESGYGSTGK